MGYVILLSDIRDPNRRGRPYCYPPSEGLGEVVCPNNNESLREKFIKN